MGHIGPLDFAQISALWGPWPRPWTRAGVSSQVPGGLQNSHWIFSANSGTLMPTSPSKGSGYMKIKAESEVERLLDFGILAWILTSSVMLGSHENALSLSNLRTLLPT